MNIPPRRFPDRWVRWIDGVAGAGGILAACFLALIVLLILVEIPLRALFHTSTLIADEYSAYFFVGMVMAGLAMSLRDGVHIRVSLALSYLKPGWSRWLDLLAHVLGIALCGFALWHATLMVLAGHHLDMRADSISETPVWIPQAMIPIGLLSLLLSLVAGVIRLARDIHGDG